MHACACSMTHNLELSPAPPPQAEGTGRTTSRPKPQQPSVHPEQDRSLAQCTFKSERPSERHTDESCSLQTIVEIHKHSIAGKVASGGRLCLVAFVCKIQQRATPQSRVGMRCASGLWRGGPGAPSQEGRPLSRGPRSWKGTRKLALFSGFF